MLSIRRKSTIRKLNGHINKYFGRNFAESVSQLRDRIAAIGKIKKVCETMRNISAARMPRLEQFCLSSRSFCDIIEPIWKNDKEFNDSNNNLFLIVSTNLGMCGNNNTSLGKHFKQYHIDNNIPEEQKTILLGSRGTNIIESTKFGKAVTIVKALHEMETFSIDCAFELTENLIFPQKFDRFVIFYNYMNSKLTFTTKKIIFPSFDIILKNKEHLDHYELPSSMEDIDHLRNLYEISIAVALYKAVSEGLAVEQLMRFNSMQSATKNIEDILIDMKRTYNSKRQEQITTEICEINAGRMAVMLAMEDN
ncbi:hypothetical protein MHBO_000492 [Bonamia ostreae]|uniref:ATP synthase gamma subunit n=1 Tax=Bonamia ostreae TaxID=126728 RepID=A0ABV2AGD3_9EUKA